MIYIEGKEICENSKSVQSFQILCKLLKHPYLSNATMSFKSLEEMTFTTAIGSEVGNSIDIMKFIYVFQKEHATIDPTLVKFIGTDELTTCVGVVIRNTKSGMISVGHLDSVQVVSLGLKQMLSKLALGENGEEFETHLIGGFNDTSLTTTENDNLKCAADKTPFMEQQDKSFFLDGYSWPLLLKIVEELQKLEIIVHVKTFCVLNHNTTTGPNGHTLPIVRGFVVYADNGSVMPACFDKSTRCPDEIVRRIRLSFASADPNWSGKLLDTYDTEKDEFVIAPCKWDPRWVLHAAEILQLSDSELLLQLSTSPFAESSDFIDNERRVYAYLAANPDWRKIFINGRARVFRRNPMGEWMMCNEE